MHIPRILADFGPGAIQLLYSGALVALASLLLCSSGLAVFLFRKVEGKRRIGWRLLGAGLACLMLLPILALLLPWIYRH